MSFLTGDSLTIRVLHVIRWEKTKGYRERSFQSGAQAGAVPGGRHYSEQRSTGVLPVLRAQSCVAPGRQTPPSEHRGTFTEI